MFRAIRYNAIVLISQGFFVLALLIAGSFFVTNTAYASGNVSGFAWGASNNNGMLVGPGWIGLNCDVDNSCGTVDWGVNIDFNNGAFSGHAWSNNIGYITFNASEVSGCPLPVAGNCAPRVTNMSTGAVVGWARACAVFVSGCSGTLRADIERGGWDGWIQLSGANHPSPDLSGDSGVTLDVVAGVLVGFAWGGDMGDGKNGVGWISFGDGATPDCPPDCGNQSPHIDLSAIDPSDGTLTNTIYIDEGSDVNLVWGTSGDIINCYVFAQGFNNGGSDMTELTPSDWYTNMDTMQGEPDTAVLVTGGGTTVTPPTGYEYVVYTIHCNGYPVSEGGPQTWDEDSVTVYFNDEPTEDVFNISLTPSAYSVDNIGDLIDLTWAPDVNNTIAIDHCIGSNIPSSPNIPGWTGPLPLPPQDTVYGAPVTANVVTYVVTCYDSDGSHVATAQATVGIGPQENHDLNVSCGYSGFNSDGNFPQPITFNFTPVNAQSCTVTVTGNGTPPVTSSFVSPVGPQSTTFTIPTLPPPGATVSVQCTPIPPNAIINNVCSYTINQNSSSSSSGRPIFEEF